MTVARTALVIGGGIVGLSSALQLQARGFKVSLADHRGSQPPASWGNAGHIATEQGDPLASFATLASLPRRLFAMGGPVGMPPAAIGSWLPFGLRLISAARPKRFAAGKAALGGLLEGAIGAWGRAMDEIGRPELLRLAGHVVAFEGDGAAARATADAAGQFPAGVSAARAPADLDAWLGALTGRPIAGVAYRGTASVADPGAVLAAMEAAFMARGGIRIDRTISPAELRPPLADVTVVAAGVRSGELIEGFGARVPIIAERGYHIQAPAPDWPADLPPVVFADRSIVVAGFTSGLRVTGFTEFGRIDMAPDERKWKALKTHAAALKLPFKGEVATWIGARPTLPDYLPAIGRLKGRPDILYAFGHQHLGLTLGPLTGEIVAALASNDKPAVDLQPFAIERFS